MNNTVTQLLYNKILSKGNAKEIANELSIKYATLMRELNIYDNNAKLGIERFFQIISILKDTSPLEYIVNLLGFTLANETKQVDLHSIDPLLIEKLLSHLQEILTKEENIEKLLFVINKPYSRMMKELNIYDPNAKLGIETFISILLFTKDIQSLFLFLDIVGHTAIHKQSFNNKELP